MQPSEIACRKCAAQPHEPCFDFYEFDNRVMKNVKKYLAVFHEERVFDAGTWKSTASLVPKELIDKAAEDLI